MVRKVKKSRLKPALFGLGLIVLAVAVLGVLQATHTIDLFKTSKPVAATGPVTKGDVNIPTTVTRTPSKSPSSAGGSSTASSTASTAAPAAPTGVFVSDHHPNLSGQPAPNTMTSDCTTTLGATCQISFTMGSTVKSLAQEATNAEGSAYWNWTLQDIGLTAGTWTITATATLNGKTASATDPQNLTVSP